MKNSKIHFGLENSYLRDFLSLSIIKNEEQEWKNKKQSVPYSLTKERYSDWAIEDCQNEISFHSKRLELLKERQAIITIIKMQGWEEFDVSDETERDLDHKLHMNFIGTKSEYDSFINSLNIR